MTVQGERGGTFRIPGEGTEKEKGVSHHATEGGAAVAATPEK